MWFYINVNFWLSSLIIYLLFIYYEIFVIYYYLIPNFAVLSIT